jgi:hypothetical protein
MFFANRLSEASMAKIASLENRLSGTLKPVTPRKEFVHGLGRQIQSGYRPTLVDKVTQWPLFALLAAALVSVVVFIGFIVHALVDSFAKKRPA